jgi:hypothetical protein
MKKLWRKVRAFCITHSRWLNIGLAAIALGVNQTEQVFCQPVTWAAWVLGLSASAFLAWPWLTRAPQIVRYVALGLQGVALVVCVYCAVFLFDIFFISLLFFWLLKPALGFLPYLFGWQSLRRAWHTDLPNGNLVFLLGVLVLLPMQLWVAVQYNAINQTTEGLRAKKQLTVAKLAEVLPRGYVTERAVGLYFRYHTNVDLYDGWRPPLHDPFINVCYRFVDDPVYIPFAARVALYRRMFPEQSLKADCYCAPYNGNAASFENFGSDHPYTDDDRAGQPGFRWPVDSVME